MSILQQDPCSLVLATQSSHAKLYTDMNNYNIWHTQLTLVSWCPRGYTATILGFHWGLVCFKDVLGRIQTKCFWYESQIHITSSYTMTTQRRREPTRHGPPLRLKDRPRCRRLQAHCEKSCMAKTNCVDLERCIVSRPSRTSIVVSS